MSKIGSQSCFTGAASKGRVHVHRKWFSALLGLALLLGSWPARADGPDDEYLQIYTLIQQADDLNTSGKAAPAKAKYQEAQTALSKFQKDYPDWNVKLVAFRLNYATQKIAALSVKPPVADSAAAVQTSGTPFKLIEAGAEPRTVLRLHPSPGDKQTLALTMKMAMETKMGEAETPAMKLPPITMTLDATVKEVSDKGDITCELVIGDISVGDEAGGTPGVADAMKAAFAGVKGISGTGTVSSRGFSQGVEFKVPAGANPQARQFVGQMKEFLTQLVAPLPEEAVGVGAKWEVKMPIKTQGMTMDQTTTCDLVSLEGERLTTKSTVVQHAARQTVENPALPGVKMDLTKMAGSGAGQHTSDLAHLLPIAGTGTLHSDTSMSMNMGGQKQVISIKMDVKLSFEAK